MNTSVTKVQPGMEAIEKLEDFIKVNRLKAHTRIPCEKDLCDLWGVSRSTLRQAVDELVENGVLYRVLNKGVYVAEPRYPRDMAGVDAMVRDLVDQGNRVSKQILTMNVIEASKQIARKLQVKLGTKVYEIIKCRKINDVPCTIETTYIDAERYPGFIEYYNEDTFMDPIFEERYNAYQTSGIEHINVTYATQTEAEILDIASGDPLFYASGVALDQNGEVVMFYKQLIRSDKFVFVATVES
ncbi:MAG: GntR family transcriptional regulator [Erysipelotrichaceae bacterium]|nr:GntR family transcriptional regulator [Erysipelotrichaceae bacterium]MBQ5444773.1 GntR family transcriptional regulator [Erysipelotrichaceae bacterium]